ncbi:ABC transporter type 1, transmembrane domain-containing protein, partial [Blyttiomyces helicus]
TCGYVPQEPWLLVNATLRDNILFGIDADEQAYHDAIRVSGLTRDFMLLSNDLRMVLVRRVPICSYRGACVGDDAFVSDVNLSASQRQRVSIARCLYHDPDIVLLEDCLSDFDQKNAKRVFKECVKTHMMKTKAVVLVTQHKQFLPDCDMILVIKNGRGGGKILQVVEQGTFTELKARKVNFSAWVTDYVPIEDDPTGLLDKGRRGREEGGSGDMGSAAAIYLMLDICTIVNEIRLDAMTTPTTRFISSPFNRGRLAKKSHKPSPLATAVVINAEPIEMVSMQPGSSDVESPADANELTIRALQQMNIGSAQNMQLNEQTISKMIERSQLSVLTGTTSRPPANFANQDMVSRTIEANRLTVHGAQAFDMATFTAEPGILVGSRAVRPWTVYLQYLSEATGSAVGWCVVGAFFGVHGVRFFSDRSQPNSNAVYIGVYGGCCSAIAIGVLARGWAFSAAVLRKSFSLHNRVLQAVLRAPMSFYDVTPLGQILSNFARHLFLIDDFLPEAALQVLSFAPILLGTILLVSIFVPWFWATLPVYFAAGWLLVSRCAESEARFKLLEASNKSPMFAHLSTTLEGLFSIRLYRAQERFDTFNRTLIDADHKALYSLMLVKTLMALYLDVISSLFIYIAALFVVIFNVGGSDAGLAISNALQLLLFVQWFVRMSGDVHASMASVGAVIYFGAQVPKEVGFGWWGLGDMGR